MNGVILIDKEEGMNSRRVVDIVGRIVQTKSVGHTGTLDPIATGVLVLCVGKATKISELITNYDKEYIAEVIVGLSTDTLDITGKITNQVSDVSVSSEKLTSVLKNFVGKISQEVPAYSAIKINGRRLYKYARNNKEIELPKRDVEIYSIDLFDDIKKDNGKVIFKIKCHVSKGTYIRSLIRDIGIELGYPTCMKALRRIKQGNFNIENCNTLEKMEKGDYKLLSIDEVLSDIESYVVNDEIEKKIRNGAIIDKVFKDDLCKLKNREGELLAIYKTYELDDNMMKPFKMFI